jgi:hypothetical protein
MTISKLAVSQFLLIGLFAPLAPTTAAEYAIDAQVRKEIADGMFLGAVVLAGTPNEVIFHKAYGRPDTGQPMTKDSLFDVGSITKVSTIASARKRSGGRSPTRGLFGGSKQAATTSPRAFPKAQDALPLFPLPESEV